MTSPTRLLFVDDEPRILDGLRRMLRDHRETWDMVFVSGGDAALAALDDQPFDVVVSDMKMPGMSGVELLDQVRQRSPRTIRLVLSGHSDREATVRAAGPAHQYLAKPCEPQVLRKAIRRALALRRLLASDQLMATISRIEHLPALPHLYRKLVAELGNPKASMAEVARIIGEDVAMAAEVLKLSNSAFFGPANDVSSIERAVQLLGFETVTMLVLRAGAFKSFVGTPVPATLLVAIGDHSIRSTRAARIIARMEGVDRTVADDAVTAALLHEVGILVLAANLPEYRSVLDQQEREGGPIGRHERGLLGTTHAEVGAYLLGLWGLPDGLVEAVAHHENPAAVEDADGVDAVSIVAAAGALAHLYGPGPFEPEPAVRFEIAARERWPDWEAACQSELTLGATR
ncbi:MAG: HDOD domain-containing protein [Gemmatimonadales bacterium]|nr:HDOD domain-containing protein [Gemmatimonadales bacterium]